LGAPSLRRRLAAWLYEAFLVFAIALVASLVFSVAVDMRSGMDPRRWLLQGFLGVVFAIYFSYLWSRGQTLAMKTWRIRVERANGEPLPAWQALLRYLLAWMWFIPGLLLAWLVNAKGWMLVVLPAASMLAWAMTIYLSPDRQFLHDRLARTRLVRLPLTLGKRKRTRRR